MILQGGMFIRNFALLVSVRPMPYFYFFYENSIQGEGGEGIIVDMHCTRNCNFFLQISSLSKHAELL